MALEIFWSKRADNKFDKILDLLSAEWGEQVTSTFVKKVYDFLDVLVEFPENGSLENVKRNIRGFEYQGSLPGNFSNSGLKLVKITFR